MIAKENPALTAGVAISTALLVMRKQKRQKPPCTEQRILHHHTSTTVPPLYHHTTTTAPPHNHHRTTMRPPPTVVRSPRVTTTRPLRKLQCKHQSLELSDNHCTTTPPYHRINTADYHTTTIVQTRVARTQQTNE
ncbi:hypothetical protein VIGAN_UM179900 [Vigna angularis var. angularis]|uniref:Uncharacterized protein n=1 Tax=Vigna angularis var. angularis TaxID=157739 RepID=A0A0S3TF88_PHAAN|nr:hypothetical protein VIGAN_UM179900 [Vigna angularis var. angularis]